jgi:hypothetical protein
VDAQKILGVLDIYEEKVSSMCTAPARADPHECTVLDVPKKYAHVWWMITTLRDFIHEGRMEKAFRWLGFIQGVLWACGMYSVEDLAGHNKPSEEVLNLDPTRRT